MTWNPLTAFGQAMKRGLIVLLLVVTSACGAYHFPGGPPPGTGTVTGHVTVIPCGGPVEPAQPEQGFAPCKMRPVSGLEIDFISAGTTYSARTDAESRYTIQLPEGTYMVSARPYMRIVSGPPAVTVKASSTIIADYAFDSGIRTAA